MASYDQSTSVNGNLFEEFYKHEKMRFGGNKDGSADLYKYFIKCQGMVMEQGYRVLVSNCGPFLIQPFSI